MVKSYEKRHLLIFKFLACPLQNRPHFNYRETFNQGSVKIIFDIGDCAHAS